MSKERVVWQKDIKGTSFRIVEVEDVHSDIEDLEGDVFDPKYNPDIDPEELARQRREFVKKVDREGVYGYALEFWDDEVDGGWTHTDSCWGFVGQYQEGHKEFDHYIVQELIDGAGKETRLHKSGKKAKKPKKGA